MSVDFYASEPWYLDHLAATWLALSPDVRGRFFVGQRGAERAAQWGIARSDLRPGRPGRGQGLVVVASHRDLRVCRGRPIVLSEHGAGQVYSDSHPAYAGGADRGDVVLFLCVNESVAERNRATYPDTPAEVVGCPKLDRYHSEGRATPSGRSVPIGRGPQGTVASGHGPDAPTVAFSWHWDYDLVPEGRSAFPHYRLAVADLARGPWKLLGHSHPRCWRQMRRFYVSVGIEPVRDFDEVARRADVYVCDNSSTIYEFAATGRPVVLLNAPWYRRDVEHGLRFWDQASVGIQVDEPEALEAGIARALEDPPDVAQARTMAVAETYGVLDSHAADRAARAIEAAAQREEERCRTRRVPA